MADAHHIYLANHNSVFAMFQQTDEPDKVHYGTAMLVAPDALVTTLHGMDIHRKPLGLFVVDGKGKRFAVENVLPAPKGEDLMLLRLQAGSRLSERPLLFDPVKDARSLSGIELVAIGVPLAVVGQDPKTKETTLVSEQTVSKGILGGVWMGSLQIIVPISAGNSGGAVFEPDGSVIGMAYSQSVREELDKAPAGQPYAKDQNLNFAVPAYEIIDFCQSNGVDIHVKGLEVPHIDLGH
jgi:hypothetical protein